MATVLPQTASGDKVRTKATDLHSGVAAILPSGSESPFKEFL